MLEILFVIFLSVFAVISAAIGVGFIAGKDARNQNAGVREDAPDKKHAVKREQVNISFQELAEIKRVIGASGRRSNDGEEEYRAMIN